MAERASERNADIIFTGTHYPTWKGRIEKVFMREGLTSLFHDETNETKYLEMEKQERPRRMASYQARQGKGCQ